MNFDYLKTNIRVMIRFTLKYANDYQELCERGEAASKRIAELEKQYVIERKYADRLSRLSSRWLESTNKRLDGIEAEIARNEGEGK